MNWRIPLSDLDYGSEEESAVLRVLKSRWLSMGPETKAFEEEFAAFIGTKHAIAVSNGTAALHFALLALGIGPADAVIQPAVNFVAAANMTVAAGATPVFADINSLAEPTLSPDAISQLLSSISSSASPPRPKAVVVMHYGGYLCRMAEIQEICRHHGLALIEDACHAIGARYYTGPRDHETTRLQGTKGAAIPTSLSASGGEGNGEVVSAGLPSDLRLPTPGLSSGGQLFSGPVVRSPVVCSLLPAAGSLGDISAFSFFSNKNLATGEGGMVVTSRDDLAEKVRLLRSHGMTSLTWDRHRGHAASYDVTAHGYNYRMDDLRAAIGREQLKKLERNNLRRRELTALCWRKLEPLEERGWTLPFKRLSTLNPQPSTVSCHLMAVVAPEAESRSRYAEALKASGIQTSLHYPLIPGFTAFQNGQELNGLGYSRDFCARVITLPLYPTMTEEQVELICGVLTSDL
jgi:dTDP-4-amino-4,6-dideoxygalactose transaminase